MIRFDGVPRHPGLFSCTLRLSLTDATVADTCLLIAHLSRGPASKPTWPKQTSPCFLFFPSSFFVTLFARSHAIRGEPTTYMALDSGLIPMAEPVHVPTWLPDDTLDGPHSSSLILVGL